MAVHLACPSCRNPLVLREEYLGQDVQCPGCQHIFRASSPGKKVRSESPRFEPAGSGGEGGYYDRERRGPVATAPRKRRGEQDEDDVDVRRRPRNGVSNSALWWMVGGAGAGLSVILLVVIALLMLRPTNRPADPVGAAQANAAVPAPAADKVPAQPAAPAPAANLLQVAAVAPVPAGNLSGEQIYQQLLKSTVFIEARNAVPGGAAPGMPRPLRPPFGGKKIAPFQQGGTLLQSVWEGTEDLPGYGRLRFEFFSPVQVTMIDAKETSVGRWTLTGGSISLDFGGAKYTGTLNNNLLVGSARNQDGTTWRWSVNRVVGAAATQAPPRTSVRSGTGALIDPEQRLVVTNVHVVGNATQVNVHFARNDAKGDLLTDLNSYKTPLSGKVVLREPRADLALIQLDGVPAGAQAVRLASKKAMAGQDVHSIGNPGASKALWIYSPGKVRAVYKDQWQIRDTETNRNEQYDAMKLETSSPINPGDSGGPLVNDRGALVGVAHGQNLAANNLSYFIEVSEVRDLMRRYYQQIGKSWQPLSD